jgi:hypothetical protein
MVGKRLVVYVTIAVVVHEVATQLERPRMEVGAVVVAILASLLRRNTLTRPWRLWAIPSFRRAQELRRGRIGTVTICIGIALDALLIETVTAAGRVIGLAVAVFVALGSVAGIRGRGIYGTIIVVAVPPTSNVSQGWVTSLNGN